MPPGRILGNFGSRALLARYAVLVHYRPGKYGAVAWVTNRPRLYARRPACRAINAHHRLRIETIVMIPREMTQ